MKKSAVDLIKFGQREAQLRRVTVIENTADGDKVVRLVVEVNALTEEELGQLPSPQAALGAAIDAADRSRTLEGANTDTTVYRRKWNPVLCVLETAGASVGMDDARIVSPHPKKIQVGTEASLRWTIEAILPKTLTYELCQLHRDDDLLLSIQSAQTDMIMDLESAATRPH